MNNSAYRTMLQDRTPFKQLSDEGDQTMEQLNVFEHLQDKLKHVLAQLQTDKHRFEEKSNERLREVEMKLKQAQDTISELEGGNEHLQSENNQLKTNVEQLLRYLKGYELKQQLLNNKIAHLTKLVSEKQAIIGYLQAKTQTNPNSKNILASQMAINLDDANAYGSNYPHKNMSFFQMKNSKDIKFQDFNRANRQTVKDEQKMQMYMQVKSKRKSTESNQNDNRQNLTVKWKDSLKTHENVTSRQFGNIQNENMSIKNSVNCDQSFWRHSVQNQRFSNRRKSNTMLNSTSFVKRRQSSFQRHDIRKL